MINKALQRHAAFHMYKYIFLIFRSLVDNFGLTDDLPSEIHIVLYDIKKFKILNKSNYMVHPPFHEIHMQNYPHKILVRRGWSKKNDKHILSKEHELIWHGTINFPDTRLDTMQIPDLGKLLFKEVDMFVFQCPELQKANDSNTDSECRKRSNFFTRNSKVTDLCSYHLL